ncbi:MAG: hypothetical protein WA790_11165 [Sulfitobacter sp.]
MSSNVENTLGQKGTMALGSKYVSLQKDIILHIGQQKTGTSSLQHVLKDSVAFLASIGICYPEKCRNGPGHHHIANFFNSKLRESSAKFGKYADNMEVLQREISEWEHKILLSSEGFQNANPSLLREVFSPNRTHVIVYIREQLDFALSAYAQGVQSHKTHCSMAAFLRQGFNPNYSAFLNNWKTQFNPASLIVRVYDHEELYARDVVRDFFQVLGLDDTGIHYDGRDKNPSIGGSLLEFKRSINRLDIPQPVLLKASYRALRHLAGSAEKFRRKPVLPESEAQAFRRQFCESNQDVALEYFDRKTLFAEKPIPLTSCTEFVFEKDVVEILTYLRNESDSNFYKIIEHYLTEEFAEADPQLAIIRQNL